MAISFSEAKKIPIVDYLYRAGIEPAKIRGNDYWYLSPFRIERNPSLKVNARLNVWYDHGSGEGGSLIDLGTKLHGCTMQEFLDKVSNWDYKLNESSFHRSSLRSVEPKLYILSTALLNNVDHLNYLKGRGIEGDIGKEYCQEVTFQIRSKVFSAIGFRNRSGGFELRNRWFKGSSSPKDISFINNNSTSLCVFEGFVDFLSWLQLKQNSPDNVNSSNFLILNSLSFLNKNLDLLKAHDNILFCLDNDLAGRQALSTIASKGISYRDGSCLYAPLKDVNDFLVNQIVKASPVQKSRGLKL